MRAQPGTLTASPEPQTKTRKGRRQPMAVRLYLVSCALASHLLHLKNSAVSTENEKQIRQEQSFRP